MDGSATWAELRRLCTQHAVRRALDEKRIIRARRGLYVLPELPAARSVAARAGGVVSHLSAAVEHGLAVLVQPAEVHVTVPSSSKPPSMPGVRWHYTDVDACDVRRRTTTVLRSVLDCAATLPFAEALAVADSSLREGFVRREDLLDAAAARHGPGRRAVLRVAAAADGDAANPFESALRATILDAGVTGFVPQQAVTVQGPRGSAVVVHVDLGDPYRKIAIEADSFAHHGGRAALRDDCRRYDELVRAGWLVLRFAWEHVVLDARWVAEVVREICAARDAA
jgi:very-short-patch-repair endonuclease